MSLPCGRAPTCYQGETVPPFPTGESSGCPRMGVMGCRDTAGHRAPGWCWVAQAGLAGSACRSQRVLSSPLAQSAPAGTALGQGLTG